MSLAPGQDMRLGTASEIRQHSEAVSLIFKHCETDVDRYVLRIVHGLACHDLGVGMSLLTQTTDAARMESIAPVSSSDYAQRRENLVAVGEALSLVEAITGLCQRIAIAYEKAES